MSSSLSPHPSSRGHGTRGRGVAAAVATALLVLAPETRVVSNMFNMGDWKPDAHDRVEFRNIYLWIVPSVLPQPGGT